MKAIIVGGFFILFFALRPIDPNDPFMYMADTSGYAGKYNSMKGSLSSLGLFDSKGNIDWDNEFVFAAIRNYMAAYNFPVEAWFGVVAILFVVPPLIGARILFPNHVYLATLFFITSIQFYAGGTNGIRNSDANSIFLLGLISIAVYRKYLVGALICYIAYSIHHSEIITIAALVLSILVVKSTNKAILIWFAAIVMALVAGNSLAVYASTFFDDSRTASYITGDLSWGYVTGFRVDFILYSAFPIWVGYYTTVKKRIKDRVYQILLNTYILANAMWIIFIYASYTNRFAALSWALYPFVICYPPIKYKIWGNKSGLYTALMLIGQTLFITIF